MAVKTISIKEIPSEKKQVELSEEQPRLSKNDIIMGIFKTLWVILTIRLFIFLSLIGSFVLSLIAIHDKDLVSISVLIAYSFLTTGPLVLLEHRGRINGG